MIANCQVCEIEFTTRGCYQKRGWGKYCSKECQYKGQRRGQFYSCQTCDKKTYRTKKQLTKSKDSLVFCSKSCSAVHKNKKRKGSKHPNWKGGKSSYRTRAIREYGLKCSSKNKCPLKDYQLPPLMFEVDHIDRNRQNNKLSNLQVLCLWCHKKKTLNGD